MLQQVSMSLVQSDIYVCMYWGVFKPQLGKRSRLDVLVLDILEHHHYDVPVCKIAVLRPYLLLAKNSVREQVIIE